MIGVLLEAGADPTFRSAKGQTALHSAARRGNWEGVSLLLEHGVKANAEDDGGLTPLKAVARLFAHVEDSGPPSPRAMSRVRRRSGRLRSPGSGFVAARRTLGAVRRDAGRRTEENVNAHAFVVVMGSTTRTTPIWSGDWQEMARRTRRLRWIRRDGAAVFD